MTYGDMLNSLFMQIRNSFKNVSDVTTHLNNCY